MKAAVSVGMAAVLAIVLWWTFDPSGPPPWVALVIGPLVGLVVVAMGFDGVEWGAAGEGDVQSSPRVTPARPVDVPREESWLEWAAANDEVIGEVVAAVEARRVFAQRMGETCGFRPEPSAFERFYGFVPRSPAVEEAGLAMLEGAANANVWAVGQVLAVSGNARRQRVADKADLADDGRLNHST